MTPDLIPSARGLAVLTALLAGGCSGGPLGSGDARPAAASAMPAAPAVAMAGRWRLVSARGGACGMTFGAGSAEGTIAPEGGCPGNFFTSRKWVFEETGLVIRDHTGQPLAQLAFAPPSRFDGRTTSGQPVTLTR